MWGRNGGQIGMVMVVWKDAVTGVRFLEEDRVRMVDW